jgi:hypothetical protein
MPTRRSLLQTGRQRRSKWSRSISSVNVGMAFC